MNTFLLTSISIFLICIFQFSCAQDEWQPLFDGKTLDGWEKHGGKAVYNIEGGAIVGVALAGTSNTFLCTQERFGDFILELEVKVDSPLNSGIQIRSNLKANDVVWGYQVEIDPKPRAWSGGIFEESGREWLYPLPRNEKGRKAFRNGQWNHYHIEAVGNHIRTWINGVPCADLVDERTAEGFIGLQVHSVDHPEEAGLTIQWRNIRIRKSNLEEAQWTAGEIPEFSYLINQLSAREIQEGWRLLWDGKTTQGWRSARADKFPEEGWEIQDGELRVITTGGEESFYGDIVTLEQFGDFELELDFKLSKGANSGIKYYVDTELNKGPGSAIGLEYQLIDDVHHPDALMGKGGNHSLASLYDLVPARNLSEPGNHEKRFKGIGKWNRARIVSRNGKVEHWLNNVKMVEYQRGSPHFRDLVAQSKYKIWPNFGELPQGHILLQEHGHPVTFRSIKIREGGSSE